MLSNVGLHQSAQVESDAFVGGNGEFLNKFFVRRFEIDGDALQIVFLIPPQVLCLLVHGPSTTKVRAKANDSRATINYFKSHDYHTRIPRLSHLTGILSCSQTETKEDSYEDRTNHSDV